MTLILANFLIAIAYMLNSVLTMMLILVIAAVIISWVNADPYNFLVRVVRQSTDPLFDLIRRKLPLSFGGLDFSPIFVLLMIGFLKMFLVQTLIDQGQVLKAGYRISGELEYEQQ